MISRFYFRDQSPDSFDNSRTFVSQHRRQRDRIILISHNQVGVADTGSYDPD
jgi:hypothetical protein